MFCFLHGSLHDLGAGVKHVHVYFRPASPFPFPLSRLEPLTWEFPVKQETKKAFQLLASVRSNRRSRIEMTSTSNGSRPSSSGTRRVSQAKFPSPSSPRPSRASVTSVRSKTFLILLVFWFPGCGGRLVAWFGVVACGEIVVSRPRNTIFLQAKTSCRQAADEEAGRQ